MQQYKNGNISVVGKISTNTSKIKNFISHKVRAVFVERKGSFDHENGVSKKFFEVTSSRTSENIDELVNHSRFSRLENLELHLENWPK